MNDPSTQTLKAVGSQALAIAWMNNLAKATGGKIMKTTIKFRAESWNSALLAALLCFITASFALAGNDGNPGIESPQSKPYGRSYQEWAGLWAGWWNGLPYPDAPDDQLFRQFENVYFLYGTSPGTYNKTITVPEGKALFVPISAWVGFDAPDIWTQPYVDPSTGTSYPTEKAYVTLEMEALEDAMTGLHCEIDGQAITNLNAYRFQCDFSGPWAEDSGMPVADPFLGVGDGYFLILNHLPAGKHTIHSACTYNAVAPYWTGAAISEGRLTSP